MSNSVLRVAWAPLGRSAPKKSNVVRIWNRWNKISNNDSLRHGVEHAELAGGAFGKHLDWLCAGVEDALCVEAPGFPGKVCFT
jgi:hypothetical protein